MIANGKDRLEWTRKVDQGQVFHDDGGSRGGGVDDDGGGGEGKHCKQLLLWTCKVNWDMSSQMLLGSFKVHFLVFLCSSPAFESSFILR